jgi:hypothetical protein
MPSLLDCVPAVNPAFSRPTANLDPSWARRPGGGAGRPFRPRLTLRFSSRLDASDRRGARQRLFGTFSFILRHFGST